jgi:hypothetical protein
LYGPFLRIFPEAAGREALPLLTLNGQVDSTLHEDAAAPGRERVAGGAEKGHQRHNTEDDADAWWKKSDGWFGIRKAHNDGVASSSEGCRQASREIRQ